MSKYTAELRTIINNGFNIFDFDYNRTEASRKIVADEDLQQGFINHFYFREIGFETLERFKHYLKTQWLESLGQFDALLVAYAEPISTKANMGTDANTKSVFKDTPQSELDEAENYATNLTNTKQSTKGFAGITEIEMLELYHNKIKDIQTEFYNSFDNLFMQIF